MFYKKNTTEKLSKELFEKPTAEYRATPFWAWNCKIDENMASEQIEAFKKMGFGGFHMHSRVGMNMEYLGEEFMDVVKHCVDKAKKEDMLAYLYDEDKWPSGFAGGYITKDPKNRQRRIEFSVNEQEHFDWDEALNEGKNYLLAVYDIVLNEAGELLSYDMIGEKDETKGKKWYVYIKTAAPSPWFNNQAYADLLDKEAMDKFIDVTYEAYEKAVGEEFGKTVPSIFTDEPQFCMKKALNYADSEDFAQFPWTMKLPELFKEKYGYDMIKHLPEIVWNLKGNEPSLFRYHYHDFLSALFTESFADNCGKWCTEHGIEFTGHMNAEQTLEVQSMYSGEVMRSYRAFGIPGIDLLCNQKEYSTAKQCQSAVHQYGREGMLCELYGVTNWDFDFRGHKFQGDWLAALGVTVRVPHLSWASMAGEAKRDYPASISYQSPWYDRYSYVEDHFARLNTVLTRGKPVVDVAVIHPIESFWINFGPTAETMEVRKQLDERFSDIIDWLLFGNIDFDFIAESLLPEQIKSTDGVLEVGCMKYKAVVVPACITLRKTTLDILKAFARSGGKVIFAGDCPKYIDAAYSDEIKDFYEECEKTAFGKTEILNSLSDYRKITVKESNGAPADNIIYSLREDNGVNWLFLTRGYLKEAHSDRGSVDNKQETVLPQNFRIAIEGEYIPKLYDTVKGTVEDIACTYKNGKTLIEKVLYMSDSMLLELTPGRSDYKAEAVQERKQKGFIQFLDNVEYKRSEPNVLMLDKAEYSLDGGAFAPEEEILRLDNICRVKLGWPYRGAGAQPWTVPKEKIEHFITLRFKVMSEISVMGALLAVEDAEKTEITFNGDAVDNTPVGWYTDKSIKTVKLPDIKKGENILTVKVPFGKRTDTEWCYILGEFGVKVKGARTTIIPAEEKIGFSPLKEQGMPFYGGNITYVTEIDTPDCVLEINANYYRGALISVLVDGKEAGVIAYSPYNLTTGPISAGHHKIEFVLYGNRVNTFGGVHNVMQIDWVGPGFWRSSGYSWCYEYRLKDTGILKAPTIRVLEQ